jgi:hypothetical protein
MYPYSYSNAFFAFDISCNGRQIAFASQQHRWADGYMPGPKTCISGCGKEIDMTIAGFVAKA